MEIERGQPAKLTAMVRWGVARMWLGGLKKAPLRRCPKCRGRFKHRRYDCKGTLEVGCIGYHNGKECQHA